ATHAAPPRQLREPTGVMSSGVGETERYPMPAGAANPGVPSVTLASTASVPPRFPRGRSARRPEVSGAPAGRSIRRRPVSRSARSTGPRGNAPRPSGAGAEDAPGEIARLAAVDPVAQADLHPFPVLPADLALQLPVAAFGLLQHPLVVLGQVRRLIP